MIWQMIEDWFRGILTDGILSNLSGLFDSVNTEVGEIATQVGTTPAGWNAGIFNMIRSLSENVIVPIAGVIITFVMCYELIQLVIEKNNLHDLDTWIFFKWIFKTFLEFSNVPSKSSAIDFIIYSIPPYTLYVIL